MTGYESRSVFPPVLKRMYSHGLSMFDTLQKITQSTPVQTTLSSCLITVTDPREYSDLLMSKSFAAVNSRAPQLSDHLRLEQQSTQAEASANSLTFFGLCRH